MYFILIANGMAKASLNEVFLNFMYTELRYSI